MNKQIKILIYTSVAFIAAYFAGSALFKHFEKQKAIEQAAQNMKVLVKPHAATMGPANAKVTLVEFLDPECETCRAFFPFVKQLLQRYPADLRLVVRYAPFHKNSQFAVRILEAARLQNKYWQTLELLFKNLPAWGNHHNPRPELIWQYLPELKLDIKRIKQDMESPDIAANLRQDIADLKEMGVRRTPGFFINGQPLQTFGYEPLQKAIEEAMKE